VYVDLLAAPISNLSFPAVRVVLSFVLPVLVGAGILRWLRFLDYSPDSWLRFSFVALTIFSYPVLEGLYAEQLGLVVGFLLAAAMAVLRAGRLALSGCLLGFSILKPQMGILLIPQWLAVVRSYKDYGTPALVTDLLGPRLGLPVIGALVAGAAWLTWRIRREPVHSETFTLGVCIVLAITSLTLLPGHALYDRVILLPGIFVLIEFRMELWKAGPTLRTLLVFCGLALFWQWIGAAVVLMTRVLAPALWNHAWFLLLPIRTSGTVPFAVLATLILVWRDVQRGKLTLRQA
jgi:hypothetical protein